MSDLFNIFCEYSNLNAAFRRVSESGGWPGADHLLDNCSVLKYLYDKVKITKYLTHTERLSILYSIGYAYNGKKLVHYFISYCANYDKNTTQKYINKVICLTFNALRLICYKIFIKKIKLSNIYMG
ncbi:MAG: hypothetical protein ACYCT7_00550 [bacterium]